MQYNKLFGGNVKIEKEDLNPIVQDIPEDVKREIFTDPPEVKIGVVKCPRLNIRKSDTKKSEVVTIVNMGDELILGASKDGWIFVQTTNGYSGYTMIEFIEEI